MGLKNTLLKVMGLILCSMFWGQSLFATGTCNISLGANYSYPVCTASNGWIQILPTGGTAPYRYSWSNGRTTSLAGSLPTGSYTVTVTDASACTATRTFTLTASSRAVSPVLTGAADTCGEGRGKVLVVMGGNGSAPYHYTWSNGSSTASLTGINAGTYSLIVSDSNGCTATASASIGNIGTPIIQTGTVTNALCPAGTGTISVSASGGTSSSYTMLWNNGATSPTISNLNAGNYTLTVHGSNGCSSVSSYTVVPPPSAIVLHATVTQPLCIGQHGSIALSPSGGTGPAYTATWSNGVSGLSDTDLAAGTYSVTVTDQNACTTTASFSIAATTVITIGATISQPVCTSANGSITAQTSGGRQPYSYLWTTGDTTVSISGLAAGNYVVTVTDANGCASSHTFSPTVYMRPLTLSTSTVADTCSSAHGRAAVTVTSGASVSPFTYLWNNTATTRTLSATRNGNYSVSVTDANGCIGTASLTIANAGENISLNPSIISPICTTHNGSVQLSPASGTQPYSYSWSTGATTSGIIGIVAGSYIATVSDYYGCSASQTVGVNTFYRSIHVSASAVADTCAMARGSVTVAVTTPASTAPFTYAWSTGDATATVTGLGAHYYTVTVTDSSGCYATTGTSVINIGTPISISGSMKQPICSTDKGSIALSVSGGTTDKYTMTWSNSGSGLVQAPLTGGTYTVTVTGSNGCSASQTFTINTIAPLTANVVSSNIKCDSSTGGKLLLQSVSGGSYPWTISWTGPNGYSSNSISLYHLEAGNYNMSLVDAHGCHTSGVYTLTKQNAFTIGTSVGNTSCLGAANGSVNLATISIYSSPTFAWSGSNGYSATSRNISGLAAGVYTITVAEPYGCIATHTDTVKPGPAISVSYAMTPVHCDTPTGGTLTNTAITGATSPWIGSWTGPNGFNSSSINLNRLSSGTYNLRLVDALGCGTTGSYHVDSVGGIIAVYTPHIITCPGSANGSVVYQSLTPYSRNATYTWTGTNGYSTASQSIYNLSAGTYNLTIAEDFGCKVSSSYTLIDGFDVGVSNIYDNLCPAPGVTVTIHPIAGDMSQLNGQHCATGVQGQVKMIYTGPAVYAGVLPGTLQPDAINGDTLTWNIADYGNLRIDSSFFVYLKIDSHAVLGTSICINMIVTPTVGDYYLPNNTRTYCMTVIHSYDPNDKIASPAGDITPAEKEISYTIHFQNTGTGIAHDVSLLDTLDSSIDPASIQIQASSHAYTLSMTGAAMRFDFAGIDLSPVSINRASSDGWIQYKVKLKDGLPLGTQITNTAYIYFDLNDPIATPTTINTIMEQSTAISTTTSISDIRLYPNPARSTVLLIVSENAIGGSVDVYDATGRLCDRVAITHLTSVISLQDYAKGMYMLHVRNNNNQIQVLKLVVE